MSQSGCRPAAGCELVCISFQRRTNLTLVSACAAGVDRDPHQSHHEGGRHQSLLRHLPRARQEHRGGGRQHLHVGVLPGECFSPCAIPTIEREPSWFFSEQLSLSLPPQRPLALGADICMYSATKYMNGKILFCFFFISHFNFL